MTDRRSSFPLRAQRSTGPKRGLASRTAVRVWSSISQPYSRLTQATPPPLHDSFHHITSSPSAARQSATPRDVSAACIFPTSALRNSFSGATERAIPQASAG